MVDDDPDTEMYYWLDEYSCVPVWYHVVFFDLRTVSRAWLKPNALCSFKANLDNPIYQPLSRNKFKARILFAKNQAKNAITLPVADRLKEYSFLARWKGRIGTPVDVDCNRKDKKRKTNNTRHNIRRELTQSQKELSRNKFLKNSSIK
ncbi:hypothetical protein QE152_g19444 [Popillia japonica]|uniref:WW domain-containing protein n=1 Tax=Popillia japonica TaxID=7064 RepID=A0AAW1KQG8_POPJA